MNAYEAQLDRIIRMGEVIARDGIGAVGMDLLLLAHDARDAGVPQVVIEVMVDEEAPVVVRERAFCRVAAALAAERDIPISRESAPERTFPAGAMS